MFVSVGCRELLIESLPVGEWPPITQLLLPFIVKSFLALLGASVLLSCLPSSCLHTLLSLAQRSMDFWTRRGFGIETLPEVQDACNPADDFSPGETVLLRAGKGYNEYQPGNGDRGGV